MWLDLDSARNCLLLVLEEMVETTYFRRAIVCKKNPTHAEMFVGKIFGAKSNGSKSRKALALGVRIKVKPIGFEF